MGSSNDVQGLFLQAVLSRKIVSYKLGYSLWVKCIEAVKATNDTVAIPVPRADDRDAWDAFVTKVNESLDALDLEFRPLRDERTGKEMFGLVNGKGDEVAQMATEYNPLEISYFKAIVEQIMLAPNETFCVSSLAALREVNYLKGNMTKTQAEVVLGSFVAKGWLVRSSKGRYSLSTRTLLELLPYLKSTYPDEIVECTICLEILTRGFACPTQNCQVRLHPHCYANYRVMHTGCPSCKRVWAEGTVREVGEGAVVGGREGGRVRRGAEGSGEEGEEEGGGDGDGGESQSQSQSQSQGKGKGKGKKGKTGRKSAATADEEEEEGEETPEPEVEEESMQVDEEEDASQPARRGGRRR